ncbi:MAG: MBL fold metallo-hydrolase, partial [Ruminococcus sp.]|nr:MBL fold metallo-hydrolase [Ruminococcus sp.]
MYLGHASLRIVTEQGKVIYVDPFAGSAYDAPADLILMTHAHADHTGTWRIKKQNEGCQTITHKEALEGGKHNTFDL